MDKVCKIFAKTLIPSVCSENNIVFARTADYAQFKIQRDIQMNSLSNQISIGICRCISYFDIELCKKYLSILFLGQTIYCIFPSFN